MAGRRRAVASRSTQQAQPESSQRSIDYIGESIRAELTDGISQSMRKIIHVCEIMLQTGKLKKSKRGAEVRIEGIDRYETCLFELIRNELTANKFGEVTEAVYEEKKAELEATADNQIQDKFVELDIEIEDRVRNFNTDIPSAELKAHPAYIAFKVVVDSNPVEEEFQADDEQTRTGDDHIPTVDPILKTPLLDPVRNLICGHIYGETAIKTLLRANTQFRCPTIGCANPDPIVREVLVVDAELTAKVRRKIRTQARLAEAEMSNQ